MLIRKLQSRLGQRGDTIVEVMIVLAVFGLALGIAYSTANRSLLNARQAQENSQATNVAQTQVERIISIGCTSSNPECDITNSHNPGYGLLHPPGDGAFCVVQNSDPDQPLKVVASSDSACTDEAGLPDGSIKTTCLNSCAAPRVFEVKVSWADALGQGSDTVTQDYTLPDTTPPPPPPCPSGETGTYPDCHAPTCPSGYTGTYPDCQAPPTSCPSGQTGTPPNCVTSLPFALTVQNKQCGVTITSGLGYGGQSNTADLVVTGPPNDTVTIHTTGTYGWFLGFLDSAVDYSVTLDSSGTATQHASYGGYINLYTWTATASDSNGNSSATVQVCP